MLAFNMSRMCPCYQIDRAGEQLKTDKVGRGSEGGEDENDRERGQEEVEERKNRENFCILLGICCSDNEKS